MAHHELYKQNIMDHYHNSPYRGSLENPDFTTDSISPSCGDRLMFDGKVSDGRVIELKFRGEGSILGQAVASLVCEHALGKRFEEITTFNQGDVLAWLGIQLGPTRLRTVVFVLSTLQKALEAYARQVKGS